MSFPPPSPSDAAGYAQPTRHPRAVVALVCGILSMTLCGLVTGIPAIILGRQVTRETAASGGTLTGRGLGQAAFALGVLGVVLSSIGIVVRLVQVWA